MPVPRLVMIANPGTPRCETFRREFRSYWDARGLRAELEVVPWTAVVPRDGSLDGLASFDRPAVVRLESPGKDADAARLLLAAGARDDPGEPECDWQSVPLPRGRLVRPALLHRGFERVLIGLQRAFDHRPHLHPTACPLAVAHMFDKSATALTLIQAGLPTPEFLPVHPATYDEVAAAVVALGWPTAYLKLNSGSSASGMVVLHPHATEPFGITTLAEIGGNFFNTRSLRRVTEAPLARAVKFVLGEAPFVQRGIRLAQIDGENFDVRVVCIRGRVAAAIFRLSSAPMTNIYLGGRRGDFPRCRTMIPNRAWLDALDDCTAAAALFDSSIVGVDLVFERGYRRHFILEVNAFGSFFPGWTDERGRTLNEIEMESADTERQL